VVDDLTRRSVSFRGVTVDQGKSYVVEDGLQMRGDLISKMYYQTSSFLCLLLKYNGISNPFALDVYDIIKLPDGSVLSAMITNPANLNGSDNNWITSTRKKKKPQFINPATKQDQNRLAYLTTKYGTAVAPTTAAKDTSVTIKNGKVVFGSGVTSIKKEDCPDPISRTKLLSTLLKNKING
jgi:hypothetical protein